SPWVMPEDYRREVCVGQALELRILVDPVGELARDPYVLSYQRSQALDAEIPDHEPELERAEAAAEGDAVVHEIGDAGAFADDEILRDVLEGALQQVGTTCVECRAIDRREQPLVRIHNQRLGAVATSEHVSHFGEN